MRGYTRMLAFAMRHRMAVAVIALATCLTSVPLYRAVKQEFIPTNVDEAEFEVSVNGPEGTNLAVMNEVMAAMEKDILATPGVRLVLVVVRRRFSRRCQPGQRLRAHRAARRAHAFVRTALDRAEEGKSVQRLQGKLHAAGRDAGSAPPTAEICADAHRCAQRAVVQLRRRRPHDIDFVFRGPELVALAGMRTIWSSARRNSAASLTPTPR
jgi:HAE1 family hydrophobic/amphiphilic exporter-1